MYGIFASLKALDGRYQSRYKIIGENGGTQPNSFYSYYDNDISAQFIYGNAFKIVFSYPIMITNYSIALAIDRSYSKSWSIYGIDNSGEHLVDRKTDVNLCNNAQYCRDMTYINQIHFFDVSHPRAFKTYLFKDFNTSRGFTDFAFRSMEFFGISLSSINSCKVTRKTNNLIFLIILSFI